MKPKFEHYTKEMYEAEGIEWVEPMLAKEIEDEEEQDRCLSSSNYFVEEKFDGTRATLHFLGDSVRCFSRRVSEKTGWFCENSDSVPHIRDLSSKRVTGTILDGEMFIPDRPFKDVSSTLNCKWDKAIERQENLGKICFNAFDIIQFNGVNVEKLPLWRRKELLQRVIDLLNSEYVRMVGFSTCDSKVTVQISNVDRVKQLERFYPTLAKELNELDAKNNELVGVSPRAYYEYIIASGGEGVIVKPIDGKYYRGKRAREYSKIKKLFTKDVIVMGYSDPTDEYKGKFPDVTKWDYWETVERDVFDLSNYTIEQRRQFAKEWEDQCRPVSKFFAMGWVGTVRFGVIITPEEVKKLPKNKKFNVEEWDEFLLLEVGECSGFDEEVREYITNNRERLLGTVIEIKANDIFKDTGKLRHPRFMRFREDKSPSECTFKDHLNEEVI